VHRNIDANRGSREVEREREREREREGREGKMIALHIPREVLAQQWILENGLHFHGDRVKFLFSGAMRRTRADLEHLLHGWQFLRGLAEGEPESSRFRHHITLHERVR
jgi:hypothetical protein